MTSIILSLSILLAQPWVSHGLLCTTMQKQTMSAFHELLRTSSRLYLCPFEISGDGCDVSTPFIYDSTLPMSKRVQCDVTVGGECKISCEVDSHFILKDGRQLSLYSLTFEKATKGSIHVENGMLSAVGSTWRK